VFQRPIIECTRKAMYSTSKIRLLSTVFTLCVPAQRTHTCKKQWCVWNVVFNGYCILCASRSKQTDTSTACMCMSPLPYNSQWKEASSSIFLYSLCVYVCVSWIGISLTFKWNKNWSLTAPSTWFPFTHSHHNLTHWTFYCWCCTDTMSSMEYSTESIFCPNFIAVEPR
jgi:hypothetical protein